jgi:serine protease inhibitor
MKRSGRLLASLVMAIIILAGYALLTYFQAYNRNLAYAASDEKAFSADKALVSANTKFAFNLFKELAAEDKNVNIFISPLSISTALAMTYNGAEGTTKDAMAKTLEFGNMSLEKVNQEYLNLIESLENADEQVKLMIGNSIWMKQEFESFVNSSFMDRVESFYNSEAFTRDFGDPQTINEINGWVDEKTDGKIDEMIQEIDPEIVMFLINAIYFKGDWVIEFDESKTQKQDFYLSEGTTVQVDMMSTSGNFSFYRGENFQAVRLPYGRDKIAMYIFLPDEGVSLDSFIAGLSPNTHEEYLSGFEPMNLIVNLPKFQVEYGVKRLNSVLEKLGMGIAFSPSQANFNGIASLPEGNLFIDYVDHKAVVKVDEKGTEAAAATIVGIGLTSVSPGFVVNRPFFFEIRDDRSGSILFMGKILNPAQG